MLFCVSKNLHSLEMASEQPCYTLINNPTEIEIPNEQQLRHDLGELAGFGLLF